MNLHGHPGGTAAASAALAPSPASSAAPRPAVRRGPRWQQQWLNLRRLRVERAQAALGVATQAVQAAQQVVDDRLLQIAQGRDLMAALTRTWGGANVAALPRWSTQVLAYREALVERVERAEYALVDDEQALEQAQDEWRQRRAELTRALAREAAVQSYLDEQHVEDQRRTERRLASEADEAAALRPARR